MMHLTLYDPVAMYSKLVASIAIGKFLVISCCVPVQDRYSVSVTHDPRTLHFTTRYIADHQERQLCYGWASCPQWSHRASRRLRAKQVGRCMEESKRGSCRFPACIQLHQSGRLRFLRVLNSGSCKTVPLSISPTSGSGRTCRFCFNRYRCFSVCDSSLGHTTLTLIGLFNARLCGYLSRWYIGFGRTL